MVANLTGSLLTHAQMIDTEVGHGMPPTRLYLPSQYNAHSQNFALTQDHRGVMYVGNFAGVLEYDGLNWRTIPTQNITKVSALLTAKNGIVYVGGNSEFGYLRPDSTGLLQFASLSQKATFRFNEILAVLEARDGIYFIAQQAIFRWTGTQLLQWKAPRPVVSAFGANQELFVTLEKGGLWQFRNGQFTPVMDRGNHPILLDNVVASLPFQAGKWLLVTRNQGIFQLANGVVDSFNCPHNAFLTSIQATSGAILSDRRVAISTTNGELIVLSPTGGNRQVIREIGGLTDQRINALFDDREGNLWLALNNGIAQLEVPSPITLFSESARQTGEVVAIRRIRNTVYLGALNGLFKVNDQGIVPVPGLNIGCFALEEVNGSLLVATSGGVYRVIDGQIQRLTNAYSLCLQASSLHPDQVYVGTETGLGVLSLSGRQTPYRLIPGLNEQIFGITEDASGNLWLETLRAGLYQYQVAANRLVHYTLQKGLATSLYNRVANTSQGVLAYNEKGIFRYNAQQDRFDSYNPFHSSRPASTYWKNSLIEDGKGNIWTVEGAKSRIVLYQKRGAGFREVSAPFLPLSTTPINIIYPDQNGLIWFGGRDGVIRYNAEVVRPYNKPYQTLIRDIQTTGDKPLFSGYSALSGQSEAEQVTLPYVNNDIQFEFAAATYPVNNLLTFTYKLENYDDTWSDARSTQNKKEYTNLPPGKYRFRVLARNIYGLPGHEAVYAFRVLPPWYGRWWVIALFLIAAVALVYWLVRWRLTLLVKEKEELENLIRERTEEVVFQKEELEKQSEELADKNDQLEKIDLIVQSINTEIDFANLFQTILTKFSVIRNMDSASFLVYEKQTNSFRFKALKSNLDLAHVESVQLTQEQVENRLLTHAIEVYDDIYRKDDVHFEPLNSPIDDLIAPRSLVTIVIKNEGRIEGFITLENQKRAQAFDQRDMNMIRNLKEHLIAAFIKTRLLEDLENTLNDLKNTQVELIRQERLASIGQLTKGIVDRILNPLNYVTNFSQLSDGLVNSLIGQLDKQKDILPTDTMEDLLDEASVLQTNLSKIRAHSNSTTRILKDMQRLLKEKSRNFLETDLNSFLDTKARAGLQEMNARYKDFRVDLVLKLEEQPVRVKLLPSEFGQVILDLMNNSFYTLYDKSKAVSGFKPEIQIATEATEDGQVVIRFRDNGKGIPQRETEKLFSPFFTTKPTADGTGLGLYMIKDVVETHRGKIEIHSKEGEYTEILMTLSRLT
ncbi:hypothetical protein GCM10028809_19210 [Spirosoma gilvum]